MKESSAKKEEKSKKVDSAKGKSSQSGSYAKQTDKKTKVNDA